MRETLSDLLRELAGEAAPRRTSWRKLRGAIWLDHAQWVSGLDLKAFAERFIHRGRSESNLVQKWKSGTTLPSRASAISLEKLLPGTQVMFDLPLYELLADAPISLSNVDKVIALHRKKVDFGHQWSFPGARSSRISMLPDDSAALVARGDIWGLTAIVALVRRAEAAGETLSHIELCKDMYRALPAVLKHPWAAPSTELLRDCINRVRARMYLSVVMFDVDWSVINDHASNPAYEPDRERRPIDPETHRFIEFEDPVLEAQLIRGSAVKEKQLAKEKRKAERRRRK